MHQARELESETIPWSGMYWFWKVANDKVMKKHNKGPCYESAEWCEKFDAGLYKCRAA